MLAAAFLEELTEQSRNPNKQWPELPKRNENRGAGLKWTLNEMFYMEYSEQ